MANTVNLRAEPRAESGKSAARALRRAGKIPAVVYGHNRAAESVQLEAASFGKLLGALESASTLLDLTIGDGAPVKALLREVQRDPVKLSDIVHVDLYEVRADEKVTVDVPVHLVGTSDGVRNFGGVLDHIMHSLSCRCFPGDIPASIDLDVTALGVGHSIHVRDVQVAKVELLDDPDLTVCVVSAPRTEEAAGAAAEPGSAEPELIRKPKAEEAE